MKVFIDLKSLSYVGISTHINELKRFKQDKKLNYVPI